MTAPQPQPTIAVPDGSVVITPAQQYAEQQEIRKAVERLTNTIDPAISEIRRDITDAQTKHAELEVKLGAVANRVTIVETHGKAAWAAIILLVMVLGVVAAFISLRH
jgi:predicted negative regulator of RcsB-dependent stress response